MVKHRFELNKEFYSNQFYGAIKWIIDEPLDFINDFANPRKAKGMKSFFKLYIVNIILRILNNVQQIYKNKFYSRVKLKKAKHYILYLYHFILFYLSSPIYKLISNLADNEWRKKKQNRNGSEMYLYYVRN
jgi:hypothetical protein